MDNNIFCISPIDGRYNKYTNPLREYFSEFALFKYRLMFEIEYLLFLKNKVDLPELVSFPANNLFIKNIYKKFSKVDCLEIKNIESKINHDVKAVEYYIGDELEKLNLSNFKSFIHFGLTSQDINNNSITLSIKNCIEDIFIPLFENILDDLLDKSLNWVKFKMISHTHGQPAVPTTIGKEIKVFHYRIKKQLDQLKNIDYYGKLGGASGNLNAHYVSYPEYNWESLMENFLLQFSLKRNKFTTQIDNYENLSVVFDNLRRINTIFIDMNKDIWQYISMNYMTQVFDKNEVGSSTMPHKINPINFENSEGNLLLGNSLLDFMSNKLPVSRLQRDLTDSTVLRSVGSIFGYMIVAYENFRKGFSKLDINGVELKNDLDSNCVVIVEGIQTILRKYGIENAYELCKDLSRNNDCINMNKIKDFIERLPVDEKIKKKLYEIDVENYIGNSEKIDL
tara:strand:- start:101 stop:1456 length:1356 start_codon:yes stop_codon:yes gene_type:complete